MTHFEILFLVGLGGALIVMAMIAAGRSGSGNWLVAAMIGAALLFYSLLPIAHEGPLGFLPNHTANYWGVQVWFDLVMALGAAAFLAAPRAREVGMSLAPWVVLILLGGSIGLYALLARLFWLEAQQRKA